MYIKFSKVRNVKSPSRAFLTDAGVDFFVPDDCESTIIEARQSLLIGSGIKIEMPDGFCGIIMNKSSISTKMNLITTAAVVDSRYEGEIRIGLFNFGSISQTIEPGMKICQMLIVPIISPQLIEESESNLYHKVKSDAQKFRGTGGFGSTGLK